MSYIVRSVVYDHTFNPELQKLCRQGDKFAFIQEDKENGIIAVRFASEIEALNKLRDIYKDGELTLFSNTGKILCTYNFVTDFTSIEIIQDA